MFFGEAFEAGDVFGGGAESADGEDGGFADDDVFGGVVGYFPEGREGGGDLAVG